MSQIETIMVTLLKEPQTRNKPIIKQWMENTHTHTHTHTYNFIYEYHIHTWNSIEHIEQ